MHTIADMNCKRSVATIHTGSHSLYYFQAFIRTLIKEKNLRR